MMFRKRVEIKSSDGLLTGLLGPALVITLELIASWVKQDFYRAMFGGHDALGKLLSSTTGKMMDSFGK